jgi:diketogulonate reductase-like aldo/keto reductase
MGYRLVDTANAYVNERAVGRGIKESGVDRKEVFLSTKLWPSEHPSLAYTNGICCYSGK